MALIKRKLHHNTTRYYIVIKFNLFLMQSSYSRNWCGDHSILVTVVVSFTSSWCMCSLHYTISCYTISCLSAAARTICLQPEEPHHFTSLLHRFYLINVTNRSRWACWRQQTVEMFSELWNTQNNELWNTLNKESCETQRRSAYTIYTWATKCGTENELKFVHEMWNSIFLYITENNWMVCCGDCIPNVEATETFHVNRVIKV